MIRRRRFHDLKVTTLIVIVVAVVTKFCKIDRRFHFGVVGAGLGAEHSQSLSLCAPYLHTCKRGVSRACTRYIALGVAVLGAAFFLLPDATYLLFQVSLAHGACCFPAALAGRSRSR